MRPDTKATLTVVLAEAEVLVGDVNRVVGVVKKLDVFGLRAFDVVVGVGGRQMFCSVSHASPAQHWTPVL